MPGASACSVICSTTRRRGFRRAAHWDRRRYRRRPVSVWTWFGQRQNRDVLGVRFIDIVFERLLDLRRQIRAVAVVPECFAAAANRRDQLFQQRDQIRTPIKALLAADRFQAVRTAAARGDADAIAFDQPAAFVGDRVGCLLRFQIAMHQVA